MLQEKGVQCAVFTSLNQQNDRAQSDNQDGAAGLLKLRNAGSLTIAQDPADAELPEMPQEAINLNAADYVLSTVEIVELLRN